MLTQQYVAFYSGARDPQTMKNADKSLEDPKKWGSFGAFCYFTSWLYFFTLLPDITLTFCLCYVGDIESCEWGT